MDFLSGLVERGFGGQGMSARAEAEVIPAGSGNTVTLTRGGQFRFQGSDLGESMDVVIAAHVFTNKWFDRDYDADNPTPAACFASPPPSPEPAIGRSPAEGCRRAGADSSSRT